MATTNMPTTAAIHDLVFVSIRSLTVTTSNFLAQEGCIIIDLSTIWHGTKASWIETSVEKLFLQKPHRQIPDFTHCSTGFNEVGVCNY